MTNWMKFLTTQQQNRHKEAILQHNLKNSTKTYAEFLQEIDIFKCKDSQNI